MATKLCVVFSSTGMKPPWVVSMLRTCCRGSAWRQAVHSVFHLLMTTSLRDLPHLLLLSHLFNLCFLITTPNRVASALCKSLHFFKQKIYMSRVQCVFFLVCFYFVKEMNERDVSRLEPDAMPVIYYSGCLCRSTGLEVVVWRCVHQQPASTIAAQVIGCREKTCTFLPQGKGLCKRKNIIQ